MTATNHALTGALIGLSVSDPLLAVPLAFVSHFILDAIPHFGFNDQDLIGKRKFAVMLLIDACLCFILVLVLVISRPIHWPVAVICAFAAASPDFMWLPSFLRYRTQKPQKPNKHILLLHHSIQWFQRPIGAVVEAAWLVGGIAVLVQLLR